jgi:1-hydroxycarotenoid 3,4-desaturase
MNTREPHVLVLGAGFGGLGSALSLAARGGCRVTVVEASDRPGGKAGVERVDGVEFDTGPSLLTLPEVPAALFAEAGTSLRDELDVLEPRPAFRYVYPNGAVVEIQRNLEETVDSVTASLGSQAGQEFRAFVDYARGVWEAAAPHFIFSEAPSIGGLFRKGPAGMVILGKIDALRTMRAAIEQRVRTPELRDLFSRFATYNGSDPRRAPATLNCISWVEMGLGGFGVQGGMHALARALERVARRHGVAFRYESRVVGVDADGGRFQALRLADGRRLTGDAVVVNADVQHLVDDLLPRRTRHGLRQDAEPSMSGWTAVARARRRTGGDRRAAHTVLFPDVYLREFEEIFDHDRCPTEPTVYLCAQEHAHGRTGWADHEPVFLMANAPAEPKEGERPPQELEALEDRVLARLDAAGLLDAGDRLVWKRTPAGLARSYPGTRGTIYGWSSNAKMAAFQRPANRVGRLPGVYLASGGAHPGGGVPLCIQSGRMAARALAADLGIRAVRAA